MSVRGGAARLLTGAALVAGLLAAGAAPALAEGDSVRVRAASSFTAGGSPGSVSVGIVKKTEGCVLVRTGLAFRLAGATATQVRVEVGVGGQWWPVPVSGSGTLTTARTAPTNPTLCKGKSVSVRYRVTFLAGAPGGRLNVIGQGTTATGRSIGYGAAASKVVGGRVATPTSTPTRKPTPTPEPSVTAEVEPTGAAGGPGEPSSTVAAAAAAGRQASVSAESGFGAGTLVMIFGGAMVAVGLALLVFLLRGSRRDRDTGGSAAPGLVVPPGASNPGGTTYRAGGLSGAPGGPPPPAAAGGSDATVIMPRLPR